MSQLQSQQYAEKSRLGRLLVNRGYITEYQLEEALHAQRAEGKLLGEILVQRNWVEQHVLNKVLKRQKKQRMWAAAIAVATTPLHAGWAMAGAPSMIPIKSDAELNQAMLTLPKGLKALDDESLAGVSAQGIAPSIANRLAELPNLDFHPSASALNLFEEEDEEETPEERLAKDTADAVLSSIGFGPIGNFIDADVTVTGFRKNNTGPDIEILPDNRIKMNIGFEVDQIAMENIRLAGDDSGGVFGSIYMTDVSYHPDSNIIVSARQ